VANTNFSLKPLLRRTTPAKQLYNESHIRTRNVVERCFGVLKRRFPILAYGCRLQINKILIIMVATSVLHNICLEANDIDAPPAPEEINDKIWMCCIVRFDRYDYTILLLNNINGFKLNKIDLFRICDNNKASCTFCCSSRSDAL
jgi:hypothetical protein